MFACTGRHHCNSGSPFYFMPHTYYIYAFLLYSFFNRFNIGDSQFFRPGLIQRLLIRIYIGIVSHTDNANARMILKGLDKALLVAVSAEADQQNAVFMV